MVDICLIMTPRYDYWRGAVWMASAPQPHCVDPSTVALHLD